MSVVCGGSIVLALVCVTAISVPVASAARWPQKHMTAAPVSAAQISAQLKAVTGYASSELTATRVCGSPAPGTYSCLADVLTRAGTNERVGPRIAPHATPATPNTGRGVINATTPTGVSMPTAFTPAYLQWAYDLTSLSATAGSNDTVAIIDAYDDPMVYADLTHFRSHQTPALPSLPQCSGSITTSCFELVNQAGTQFTPGTTPPSGLTTPPSGYQSWNLEESLDVDAVSSLCPLCKILMVEANSTAVADLQAAANRAATLGANQISMSFGGDEPANASGEGSGWSFGSASALAAVGDGSYPGPPNYADNYEYWDGNPADTVANYVGYPAALQNVTAVGGSSLAQATNSRGFGESTWSITTPCAFTYGASGHCSGTESGCDTSQVTPPWQQSTAMVAACSAMATAAGTMSSGGRGYSDVSADADPNTGLLVYDTRPGTAGCQTSNDWCAVGGTSLATPLTAAFEAVTGVSSSIGHTPAWAYGSDAAYLNDIVSGSDGTCPSGASLLCNAGIGWDGPTGNGSISGDVVTGPPGIGGASESAGGTADSPTANLAGGVYPNGADTTVRWEYGLTTSYGSETPTVDEGSGPTLVSAAPPPLTGLTQCDTYHYRLDATNSDGTTYGYDNTFTASQSAPANTGAPTISGAAVSGNTLTAGPGTWSASACAAPTVSYQWQESPTQGGSYSPITGATSSTYTPTTSDGGDYIWVSVTESNAAGSATATSPPVGPVLIPSVITTGGPGGNNNGTGTTSTSATTTPTSTLTAATNTSAPKTTTIVQFYRCAHTCTLIKTDGARTYTVKPADDGMYIELKVTTTEPGVRPVVKTRWTGPIRAPSAGAATFGAGARVASILKITGSKNAVLAHVQVAKRTARMITLTVTPQGRIRTKVWAYVVSKGDVVSCTVSHTLKRKLTLRVPLKKGQSVKLVAVRS